MLCPRKAEDSTTKRIMIKKIITIFKVFFIKEFSSLILEEIK
tara:strand:- start:105 stop:230 length:126 start_codon:yes stop_codon:yes gene_type:complete